MKAMWFGCDLKPSFLIPGVNFLITACDGNGARGKSKNMEKRKINPLHW